MTASHRSRWRYVAAGVAFLAASFGFVSSTPRARADGPTVVRNLTVRIAGDTATLTWTPPASGSVGSYLVRAYPKKVDTSPNYGTRIVMPAPNNGPTTMTWNRLPMGTPVQFTVQPYALDVADNSGYAGSMVSGPAGPRAVSAIVTGSNAHCPSGTATGCVVVDTSDALHAETRPGAGVLHGIGWANHAVDVNLAKGLNLNHWRIQANSEFQYNYVVDNGLVPAKNVIEVISDGWTQYVSSRGYSGDPWANWDTYRAFIKNTALYALSKGRDPYWEIQNEPEVYSTYTARPSRKNVQQQYLEAYRAITDAYASAAPGVTPRIIGPSIQWAYETTNVPIDMKSFIPFAAANGLKFAAIAWHENSAWPDQSPLAHEQTPQRVVDDAATVRALIAENPGIGAPQLFVDEQSSPAGHEIPGWTAGYLAEQERANLDLANRSSAPTADHLADPSARNEDTFGPSLDRLLNASGAPNDNYWVMADYASLSGNQVRSETNDDAISALAVRDGAGATRILLGRHQTCSQWTVSSAYCEGPSAQPDAGKATTIKVLVSTQATAATVSMQAIANSMNDRATAPPTQASHVKVSNGVATVSVPAFRDGEAYFIVITPNATAGAGPAAGDR